eukprot:m.268159 g.268159  ORF g.268159 m.268159 type:complete len:454 (-) comp76870_c0_seq1:397-1758(-)
MLALHWKNCWSTPRFGVFWVWFVLEMCTSITIARSINHARVCTDRVDTGGALWVDKYGDCCQDYAELGYCDEGGWDVSWGTIESYKSQNGLSARDACCVCGGGDEDVALAANQQQNGVDDNGNFDENEIADGVTDENATDGEWLKKNFGFFLGAAIILLVGLGVGMSCKYRHHRSSMAKVETNMTGLGQFRLYKDPNYPQLHFVVPAKDNRKKREKDHKRRQRFSSDSLSSDSDRSHNHNSGFLTRLTSAISTPSTVNTVMIRENADKQIKKMRQQRHKQNQPCVINGVDYNDIGDIDVNNLDFDDTVSVHSQFVATLRKPAPPRRNHHLPSAKRHTIYDDAPIHVQNMFAPSAPPITKQPQNPPKKLTHPQCDVCKKKYYRYADAIRCEALCSGAVSTQRRRLVVPPMAMPTPINGDGKAWTPYVDPSSMVLMLKLAKEFQARRIGKETAMC